MFIINNQENKQFLSKSWNCKMLKKTQMRSKQGWFKRYLWIICFFVITAHLPCNKSHKTVWNTTAKPNQTEPPHPKIFIRSLKLSCCCWMTDRRAWTLRPFSVIFHLQLILNRIALWSVVIEGSFPHLDQVLGVGTTDKERKRERKSERCKKGRKRNRTNSQ